MVEADDYPIEPDCKTSHLHCLHTCLLAKLSSSPLLSGIDPVLEV